MTDFRTIADRADLQSLIVADRGQPDRAGKWLCPFHDDHNPSLGLVADGRRFKCFACGAGGDAIEWRMKRGNLTFADAIHALDPSAVVSGRSGPRPLSAPAPPVERPPAPPRPVWHDDEWQAVVDALVVKAERNLWGAEGVEGLQWLRGRGLADRTIKAFRLGFFLHPESTPIIEAIPPKRDGKPRGIFAPRGITIPWIAPASWYTALSSPEVPRWCGVNVRRLMPDVFEPWLDANKCTAFAGSERGFTYPHADLTVGVACVIVEGETDALLTFQEVGHMVNVATTGGASTPPRPEMVDELVGCPLWLIATDHDDAGDEASNAWRQRGGDRCRRLQLPFGKDIGEFVQAGGDLRTWLASELERLGLPPASRS